MLNPDTNAATLPVNTAMFEQIRTEYDVFMRDDFRDEVILDTHGFDPNESPLRELAPFADGDAAALANNYLILYHDTDLD